MTPPTCCVCPEVTSRPSRADTVVRGYQVCHLHVLVMERAANLFEAIRICRHETAVRGVAS